jgi:hypothetical protein
MRSTELPYNTLTQTTMPCSCLWTVRLALMSIGLVAQQSLAQTTFLRPLQDTAPTVRYDTYTPSECLAAVMRIGRMARRADGVLPDTTVWQETFLENDTALVVQRRTAATCVAHLDFTTASPREFPNLARLYWFAGDMNRTRRAIARRLTFDHTDSARAATYRQLLTRFLLERQRDVPLTTHLLLPGLDSLTSLTAHSAQFIAHTSLAYTFAASRRPDAGDSLQAEIDAAIHSFKTMPAVVQSDMVDTLGHLITLGAAETTERGDTARAHRLLDAARRLLPKLPEGAGYVHNAEAIVRYFGVAAPAIHADFVYGAAPGATPAGPWPMPGRWTLVAPMPLGEETVRFFKNLHAALGDSLDIVFVAATRGYWRPHGPLTSEQEGAIMYDYIHRRWAIPSVLLVETRRFHSLPDGRRFDEPTVTPDIYSGDGLIIDPHGTIRAMVQPSTLVRFDLLLATLMHQRVAGVQP